MNIPFLDIRASYLDLKDQLDDAIGRVLDSGWYVLGAEIEQFEREYAQYCGAQHCIGVANGLDALHLALLALGVGTGDEVIVPSNTYIATWLAVSQCGAIPVPVEPENDGFNIDPGRIEAALTPKTKVILPVHLYGHPANLAPILEIARRHGLRVLEDAAQAHGARYEGKRIGGHGDVTAWSFYPGKNLGAFGDGGAITTNIPEIDDRIRLLRNYGSRKKYVNEICGFNSRLDPLQAAVLRVKLQHIDRWNDVRRRIAQRYLSELADASVSLPVTPKWCEPVWHLFVIRSKERDRIQRELANAGIGTLIHYPIPPHLQSAYSYMGNPEGSFPLSEQIHREVLSLPIGPHMTDRQTDYVIASLGRILG